MTEPNVRNPEGTMLPTYTEVSTEHLNSLYAEVERLTRELAEKQAGVERIIKANIQVANINARLIDSLISIDFATDIDEARGVAHRAVSFAENQPAAPLTDGEADEEADA